MTYTAPIKEKQYHSVTSAYSTFRFPSVTETWIQTKLLLLIRFIPNIMVGPVNIDVTFWDIPVVYSFVLTLIVSYTYSREVDAGSSIPL